MSRKHPTYEQTPEGLLGESRRLTDKIVATRREWEAGRGNDYGTAVDYITSVRRRGVIVEQLRGMCGLVVDNSKEGVRD